MTFDNLNLNKPLWNALEEEGYTIPTTIQTKVFSIVMSGRDVQGIAQTGTGKTFAYLLPLLRMWKFSKTRHAQILILVPTRELVVQVVEQAQLLTKYMNAVTVGVYGGTSLNVQALEVANGLDIVVGTPGRVLDLGYHGSLNLKQIKKFVIDEFDEMLNLGFKTQIKNILELLPDKRQNLLFSATDSEEADDLIEEYFNAPERIEAAPAGSPVSNINQTLYRVPNYNTKINLLRHLLKHESDMTKVLLFVSTKAIADSLFDLFHEENNEWVGLIHSNKDQNFRFRSLNKFKDGTIRMLIATDILSRGLDIDDVSHVINFDLPETPNDYIHRIGRTGRADKKGESIALVSDFEVDQLALIEEFMNQEIALIPTPEDVEISDKLIFSEMPVINMKNALGKAPTIKDNSAFHEKKAKNQKVNVRVSKKDRMQAKYGKPQKKKGKVRGQK